MDNLTKNDKANEETTTLADMPVGSSGKILKIIPHSRGEKKFADVGLISGHRACNTIPRAIWRPNKGKGYANKHNDSFLRR